MPVVDYIDVSSDEETAQITTQCRVALHDGKAMFVRSDDIIDLSSDDETVQQDHIASQPLATLLDTQVVHVVADDERQGVQGLKDFFVETGEGRQEATESGYNVKAAASSSVAEKGPLDTAATHNCPLIAMPFPSPTSTTPAAMPFEGNDGNLLRVKVRRPRKNYHTETPKRSPRLREKCIILMQRSGVQPPFRKKKRSSRLGEKHKGNNKYVEQLAVDPKTSCMLEPAEEPATSSSYAESSKTLSTGPSNLVCLLNMIPHETDFMPLV